MSKSMYCKCGRFLEKADTDGRLYHEADLFWSEEPDCLGSPGERAPLCGAAPADPYRCKLLKYKRR
jgi:hypothetical protein